MDVGDVFIVLGLVAIVIFLVISSKKEEKRKAALKQARLDEIKENADSALRGPTVNVNVAGGVNEALRMAQVKCTQCGASIEPGMKFCGHCGTQVPDDAFHAEINVNDPARLEAVRLQAKINKAHIANQKILAEAEAAKAKAEAKKILSEQRGKKGKHILGIITAVAGGVLLIGGLLDFSDPSISGTLAVVGAAMAVFGVVMALMNRT